jgi:tRNA A-37 threonylcarbamoyl transferase component Bud32
MEHMAVAIEEIRNRLSGGGPTLSCHALLPYNIRMYDDDDLHMAYDMSRCSGKTLRSVIVDQSLDLSPKVLLLQRVVKWLHELNHQQIFHNDAHIDNILVQDWDFQVIDWDRAEARPQTVVPEACTDVLFFLASLAFTLPDSTDICVSLVKLCKEAREILRECDKELVKKWSQEINGNYSVFENMLLFSLGAP